MPTRSGKQYLKPYLCQNCMKFYSLEIFNNKCSRCYSSISTGEPATSVEFEEKCNEWATTACIKDNKMLAQLKQVSKLKKDILLYSMLQLFKNMTNQFLFAKDALELYHDNPTITRAHIVASMVGDWWNINSNKTTWPSFCSCYYGNYDEILHAGAIPPRMPNNIFIKLAVN